MKKNLFVKFIALGLIGFGAWSLSGCEKDIVKPVEEQVGQTMPGKFRHEITLHDGLNSATLAISADNEAALLAFESSISMTATATEAAESNVASFSHEPAISQVISEENAVHISVLSRHLQPEMKGIELHMNGTIADGKVNNSGNYSGGPYYFYSWEAPHYFKVTPLNGRCVSAWFQQAGSTWTPVSSAGGSGGYYLCSYFVTMSSSNNNLDFRLKAQGSSFNVYWY